MRRPEIADFSKPEELLVHLFAGSQTRVYDLDVIPLGTADQEPRNVGDIHGHTHVQHQSLTGTSDGSGLEHQLTGLGNGHEVPGDVGMSDRYRTTFFNLPRECFQDRATRSEYVAEAN